MTLQKRRRQRRGGTWAGSRRGSTRRRCSKRRKAFVDNGNIGGGIVKIKIEEYEAVTIKKLI